MALEISVPLNEVEKFMLKDLFESDLASTYFGPFDPVSLLDECEKNGFSREQSEEALVCLLDRDLVSGHYTFGSSLPGHIHFTDQGFEEACQMAMNDYDEIKERVARHLVEHSTKEHIQLREIASALDTPFLVAHHFVNFFAALGWARLQRENSESAYVNYVSPLLKRALEGS